MDAFYGLSFKRGKSAKAKVWPGEAAALTTVPLKRYNCGMTVGHGWYQRYSHTDPVGSPCTILGWFSDGRVSVSLPHGGCGLLGCSDVKVVSWPDYVPIERQHEFAALPACTRVVDGEMTGYEMNSPKDPVSQEAMRP